MIVKTDGVTCPLANGEGDIAGGDDVAVEVVVGIVLRQIVETAHAQCLGIRQRQTGIFLQNGVHVRGRQLYQVHFRVKAVIEGVHHLLPLLLTGDTRQTGAVVEQGVHVDVLRLLIEGSQELAADGGKFVEEFLVEIVQFLLRQGDVPLFGPGKGRRADHRRQGNDQEQRRRHRLPVFGDTGDAVLQPPLAGGHGGGGQQGTAGAPPHRDQGQQRLAVGDAFPVVQAFQGALVAG